MIQLVWIAAQNVGQNRIPLQWKKWKFEWCLLSVECVCVRLTLRLRYVASEISLQLPSGNWNCLLFLQCGTQNKATACKCCSQNMWVSFTLGKNIYTYTHTHTHTHTRTNKHTHTHLQLLPMWQFL